MSDHQDPVVATEEPVKPAPKKRAPRPRKTVAAPEAEVAVETNGASAAVATLERDPIVEIPPASTPFQATFEPDPIPEPTIIA